MAKRICRTCSSKALRDSVGQFCGDFRVFVERCVSGRMHIKAFTDRILGLFSRQGVPLEVLFEIHMVDEGRADMPWVESCVIKRYVM